MMRYWFAAVVLAAMALVCAAISMFLWNAPAARLSQLPDAPTVPRERASMVRAPCFAASFEQSSFIICAVDSTVYSLSLHVDDQAGTPWQSLKRFAVAREPVFAMNAGMYHEDLSPVGLYVENGIERASLNLDGGKGNFFLKPNGVFGLDAHGKPFIVTSEIYASSKTNVSWATQSGPMLVIGGALHPKFEPDGTSRNIRNGVGIDSKGRAVFVISRDKVSFGKFARLFRDALKCQNALYFDGVVSAFSQGDSVVQGGAHPVGPIVAVFDAATPTLLLD